MYKAIIPLLSLLLIPFPAFSDVVFPDGTPIKQPPPEPDPPVFLSSLSEECEKLYELSDDYKNGYRHGYNGWTPRQVAGDYEQGWWDGHHDSTDGKPNKFDQCQDDDPDSKAGGYDPVVLGKWRYLENAGARCETEHKFDYDNDWYRESFCYVIEGSIFSIDWDGDGKITSGSEILNFANTSLEHYDPIQYIRENPATCDFYDCYIWHDTDHDWVTDKYELIPFELNPLTIIAYNDDGRILDDNSHYIYCQGKTTEGHYYYCLRPTYWERGIL